MTSLSCGKIYQKKQGKPISALVLSRAVEHATTCLATPRCFVVVQGFSMLQQDAFFSFDCFGTETFQYRFRFREKKLHPFTPLSPPAWFLPVNRWDAWCYQLHMLVCRKGVCCVSRKWYCRHTVGIHWMAPQFKKFIQVQCVLDITWDINRFLNLWVHFYILLWCLEISCDFLLRKTSFRIVPKLDRCSRLHDNHHPWTSPTRPIAIMAAMRRSYTLESKHGTKKWRFGRWFSFANGWFSGSSREFSRVYLFRQNFGSKNHWPFCIKRCQEK